MTSRNLLIAVLVSILLVLACNFSTTPTVSPESTAAAPTMTNAPTMTTAPTSGNTPTAVPTATAFFFSDDPQAETILRQTISIHDWPLVFLKDFSRDLDSLEETDCGLVHAWNHAGKHYLEISVSPSCQSNEFSGLEESREFSDLAVGVWVDQLNNNGVCGISFRAQLVEGYVTNSYQLRLDEERGVQLLLQEGNVGRILVGYIGANFVKAEGENFLAVVAEGPSITGYVNGRQVLQVQDGSLQKGLAGVFARVDEDDFLAQFTFDNWVLLTPAEEAVTPPGEESRDFCEEYSISEAMEWVVEENFDSSDSSWPQEPYENDYLRFAPEIVDGTYIWRLESSDRAPQGIAHPLVSREEIGPRLLARVTIESVSGSPGASAGIFFYESPEGGYFFSITDRGLAQLFLRTGSDWELLAEEQFEGINPSTPRSLAVEVGNETIGCVVGSQGAFAVSNTETREGGVGLGVCLDGPGLETAVVFDDYALALPVDD